MALVRCGFWVLCAMVVFSGFLVFDMCLLVGCAWFCFWFGTAIWVFLGLACVRVFCGLLWHSFGFTCFEGSVFRVVRNLVCRFG